MINTFNKLWYQEDYSKSQMEDLIANRNYIQKYIDLYAQNVLAYQKILLLRVCRNF